MEANPGKFKLLAEDLQERKAFVGRMREAVQVRRLEMGERAACARLDGALVLPCFTPGNEGPYGQPRSGRRHGEEQQTGKVSPENTPGVTRRRWALR